MTTKYDFTEQELNTPVKTMRLSTRATNALRATGAETLGDVIQIIESGNLDKIRNIGTLCVNQILNKVAEMQTKKYRDTMAAVQELERKASETQQQIDEYNKIIEQLNKQQTFYRTQIATIKNNNKGY